MWVIKSGDKYTTYRGGYTKDINKAEVFCMEPQILLGKERIVEVEIREVEE